MSELARGCEDKPNVALTWLEQNAVISNPEKFLALSSRKDRKDSSAKSLDFFNLNFLPIFRNFYMKPLQNIKKLHDRELRIS